MAARVTCPSAGAGNSRPRFAFSSWNGAAGLEGRREGCAWVGEGVRVVELGAVAEELGELVLGSGWLTDDEAATRWLLSR